MAVFDISKRRQWRLRASPAKASTSSGRSDDQGPQRHGLFNARAIMIALIALVFLLIGLWWWNSVRIVEEEYASFTRADRHYKVVVTRKRSGFALMPGQTSDSPGTVRLLDRAGKILGTVGVEMVQLVDHVDWQDKKASIKLVADWDLPD